MARVKAVRDTVYGEHVDIGRQRVVDAAPQCFGRQRLSHIQMRNLPQRVDTGIGASRSHELEALVADRFADRTFELALHGPRVLLLLPAAVARSGVLDRELVSWH